MCVYMCVYMCVRVCTYEEENTCTYILIVREVCEWGEGESGGCVCVYYTYVHTVHVTSNLQVSAGLLRQESANGRAAGC